MQLLVAFFGTVKVHQQDIESLFLVGLSALLGSVLGLEREFASKPAGIRTHIFVAAASTLLMILAQESMDQFQRSEHPDLLESDPIRVLQAIVVGISFLGAGTIVHHRGEGVEGLTTASTILMTAGIGVSVAVDRIVLAIALTGFALLVLFVVGRIEKKVQGRIKRAGAE